MVRGAGESVCYAIGAERRLENCSKRRPSSETGMASDDEYLAGTPVVFKRTHSAASDLGMRVELMWVDERFVSLKVGCPVRRLLPCQ